MTKLRAQDVEAELLARGGNMASVGRALGVKRNTVFNFVSRRPALRRLVEDLRETRIDLAESALDKAVERGEGWAISLTLKTIGRSRGYYEKTEIDVRDLDRAIEVELEKLAARRAGEPSKHGGAADERSL
jgi:hypothetical protein